MNIPPTINNYFINLKNENSSADQIFETTSKEHPNYLRFLPDFLENNKMATSDMKERISERIVEDQSVLERLPLEIKTLIFSFLGQKEQGRMAGVSSDQLAVSDDVMMTKIIQNEGRISNIGIPIDSIKNVLARNGNGNRIKALQLENMDLGSIAQVIQHCPNLTALSIKRTAALQGNVISLSNPSSFALQEPMNDTELGIDQFAESLGKLTNIEDLSIENVRLGDNWETKIFPEMGKLTTLQKLSLRSNGIKGSEAFAAALKNWQELKQIDLGKNLLYNSGAIKIFPVISQLTALQEIILDETDIGAQGLKTLALKNLPKLQSLNLSGNNLTDTGIKGLVSQLDASNLKYLVLSQNQIGPEGAAALASLFANSNKLVGLNLGGNFIRNEGMKSLAPALAKQNNLKHLDLSNNEIEAAGIASLASSLIHLTQLQSLKLGLNVIGPNGAAKLAIPLSKLTELEELDIGGDPIWRDSAIGPEGAKMLFPALGQLIKLRKLDLACNHIDDAGVQALALILGRLIHLEELNLRQNRINSSGATSLSQPFQQLTHLTHLNLGRNSILAEGIIALAPALSRCSKLQDLKLDYNAIDDSGAGALVSIFDKCKELYRLSLRLNNISIEAMKPVIQSLANLSKLREFESNPQEFNKELEAILREKNKDVLIFLT